MEVARGRPPGQASGSEEGSTNLTSESREVESFLVKFTRVGVLEGFTFLDAFFPKVCGKCSAHKPEQRLSLMSPMQSLSA